MSSNLYSVRIVCGMEQRELSLVFQEFFKFCGIYVLEYLTDQEDENESSAGTIASVNLILDNPSEETLENIMSLEIVDVPASAAREVKNVADGPVDSKIPVAENKLSDVDTADVASESTPADAQTAGTEKTVETEETGKSESLEITSALFRKVARYFIKSLVETEFFREIPAEELKCLLEVFLKYDYMRNYFYHSLSGQLTPDELLEYARMYQRCYFELYTWRQKEGSPAESYRYVSFALLNCARKLNDICRILGNSDYFIQEVLMNDAASLTVVDSEFTMGIVLAGLLGLGNSELRIRGEQYLKGVISKEKGEEYLGFVCYGLGHFYETEDHNERKAWEYYDKCLELNAQNYRAWFKKGYRELMLGDYVSAYVTFRKILQMMEGREKYPLLFEAEYAYKCSVVCCELAQILPGEGSAVVPMRQSIEKWRAFACAKERFSPVIITEKDFTKNYGDKMARKLEGHRIQNLLL